MKSINVICEMMSMYFDLIWLSNIDDLRFCFVTGKITVASISSILIILTFCFILLRIQFICS